MIEKQTINDRDVWIRVDPYKVERSNPDIIPTEYFTVSIFTNDPSESSDKGELIKDEQGNTKLFESPVAALSFARKTVEQHDKND
ncbi:MAG TPA: hypothetical protein VJ499_12585 [Flavisolibacter sp.]|nr:hypothetical protein [Flavisolibacter sp.]